MGLRHAIGFYAAAAGAGYPAILDDGLQLLFMIHNYSLQLQKMAVILSAGGMIYYYQDEI